MSVARRLSGGIALMRENGECAFMNDVIVVVFCHSCSLFSEPNSVQWELGRAGWQLSQCMCSSIYRFCWLV